MHYKNCLFARSFCIRWQNMGRAKRIWYLSPMRAAKVQASLRIRAVSPEPSLLAYTSSESRGTFRQKASSLAPLNGWACAVKICHDGMLEDTNSLDAAHILNHELLICIKIRYTRSLRYFETIAAICSHTDIPCQIKYFTITRAISEVVKLLYTFLCPQLWK